MKSSAIQYSDVQKAIPELAHTKFDVVIIGYHFCPYSKKAQGLLQKNPAWRGKSVFVGYDFGDTHQLKQQLNYHGTFPIIFVRQGDSMHFIGGSDDFEKYIASMSNVSARRM